MMLLVGGMSLKHGYLVSLWTLHTLSDLRFTGIRWMILVLRAILVVYNWIMIAIPTLTMFTTINQDNTLLLWNVKFKSVIFSLCLDRQVTYNNKGFLMGVMPQIYLHRNQLPKKWKVLFNQWTLNRIKKSRYQVSMGLQKWTCMRVTTVCRNLQFTRVWKLTTSRQGSQVCSPPINKQCSKEFLPLVSLKKLWGHRIQ